MDLKLFKIKSTSHYYKDKKYVRTRGILTLKGLNKTLTKGVYLGLSEIESLKGKFRKELCEVSRVTFNVCNFKKFIHDISI
jgi:hypothetical protein